MVLTRSALFFQRQRWWRQSPRQGVHRERRRLKPPVWRDVRGARLLLRHSLCFPSSNHEIFYPVHDEQISFIIEIGDITCSHPISVDKSFLVRIWLFQYSLKIVVPRINNSPRSPVATSSPFSLITFSSKERCTFLS